MSRPIQIAPSVLPADFSKLGDEVAALEAAGVDLIQWDVMDGQFVPNLTFGPDVIASARSHTSVPFEAHLMVYTPDVMAEQYIDAGCSRLIVHAEACTHLHRTLGNINDLGATAAVALNPATPASGDRPRPRSGRPGTGHDGEPRLRWAGLPSDDGAEDRRDPGDDRRCRPG